VTVAFLVALVLLAAEPYRPWTLLILLLVFGAVIVFTGDPPGGPKRNP